MFTLKLYGEARQRIVDAESFTIYSYSDYSKQITTHQKDAERDGVFYVGKPDDCPIGGSDMIWYHKAIIENAAGKTTEIIAPNLPECVPERGMGVAVAGRRAA